MHHKDGPVQRWRCVCAYDGTEYAGWQKQPTKDSVQDAIEEALSKIFQTPVRTIGAGRTDGGVHASGQVFHLIRNGNMVQAKCSKHFEISYPLILVPEYLNRFRMTFMH